MTNFMLKCLIIYQLLHNMLRTCNFEISSLEERSQIIGEVHLNWADLIWQQLVI